MRPKIFSIAFFVLVTIKVGTAQIQHPTCGYEPPEIPQNIANSFVGGGGVSTLNGESFTPQGEIRFLIIYCGWTNTGPDVPYDDDDFNSDWERTNDFPDYQTNILRIHRQH